MTCPALTRNNFTEGETDALSFFLDPMGLGRGWFSNHFSMPTKSQIPTSIRQTNIAT